MNRSLPWLLSIVCLAVLMFAFAVTSNATGGQVTEESPADGDAIVFTLPRPEIGLTTHIWIMSTDGANATQVTNAGNASDRFPAISPDGTKIAYDSGPTGTIWLIDRQGSNAHPLTPNLNNGVHQSGSRWSPNGTKIAFSSDAEDWWEIWVCDSDGSNARRLTTTLGASGQAAWSPNGLKIAFNSEPSAAVFDLYTVDITGTNQQLLLAASADGYSHHSLAWSPDGMQIASIRFPAGNYNGQYDVWLMNADGTNGHVLVRDIDSPRWNRLSWSVDGNWLFFGKGGNVWRVHRTGSDLKQITTSGGWEPATNALSLDVSHVYIPAIYKPRGPKGIYGQVTVNGARSISISVDLRFYNGNAWSTADTKQTDSTGTYSFPSASSLVFGEKYYVRYANAANDPSRLWIWATRVITQYTPSNEVAIGDFDLAEIPLVSPANNGTVFLPTSFQWSRRPAVPTDSYALTFRDRNTGEIVGQTPPLGYVDSVTIGALSSKMSTGVPYAWEVWAQSPDGGYGISYGTRIITFGARSGLAPMSDAQAPLNTYSLDIPTPDVPSRSEH